MHLYSQSLKVRSFPDLQCNWSNALLAIRAWEWKSIRKLGFEFVYCITEVLFRVFRNFLIFPNILEPLCYVVLYKFTLFMNSHNLWIIKPNYNQFWKRLMFSLSQYWILTQVLIFCVKLKKHINVLVCKDTF